MVYKDTDIEGWGYIYCCPAMTRQVITQEANSNFIRISYAPCGVPLEDERCLGVRWVISHGPISEFMDLPAAQ
jgi:hypothetical protein